MKNCETDIGKILEFIGQRNRNTAVDIKKISLSECSPWYYDQNTGTIHNQNRSFFEIPGFVHEEEGKSVSQPILLQSEIGYLGMLCHLTEDGLEFLMQAKIEPGNLNCIQISPTIQATKSNFTQMHGGRKPAYLEYFLNVDPGHILVDQIQSEQSSRFLGKRNRNIIVMVDNPEEIEVLPTHMWMSLRQLKKLMKYDNLVNMDTRTVLSCIPFCAEPGLVSGRIDEALRKSVLKKPEYPDIVSCYHAINNLKMFSSAKSGREKLFSLPGWSMKGNEFVCDASFPFKVIFCDISIEGREVKQWNQPLFEATGKALFCLAYHDFDGVRKFLVKVTPEIGCFDFAELGPTVQREADSSAPQDEVEKLLMRKISENRGIEFDSRLSEEGGRFYHEENRNVIIRLENDEIPEGNEKYFWCDYATLNALTQINNCLNIQLRNLLSLLEIF